MLYKILITLLLITTSNAQNFKNQLSGGYSGRGGNTEYWYYNLNYALTANGDINFGSLTLKDSEFLLSLDRNVSEYNGAPYYNDQTIVFKFDLWANGTFSPFVIAETAFDEALGIKKRQNFGLGAKYRVLGDFLSVSAAFLSEKEEVFGKNNVFEYVDYDTNNDGVGDSLGVYAYSNYGDMPTFDYSRISIRPKLKLPLGDNFYYQTEYYYKPAGDDVLTNWNNTFSISTAAIPTPPVAPSTRHVSPLLSFAQLVRALYAVPYITGNPAAISKGILEGILYVFSLGTTTSDWYPPYFIIDITKSPILCSETFFPKAIIFL